jgi:hypothetical protein
VRLERVIRVGGHTHARPVDEGGGDERSSERSGMVGGARSLSDFWERPAWRTCDDARVRSGRAACCLISLYGTHRAFYCFPCLRRARVVVFFDLNALF